MRKIIIGITLLVIGYWLLGKISPVEAAYFQFDPASTSVSVGQTVSIKLNIDAGSDEVSSTDAYVLYDPTYLKVQSVTAGSYFPTVTNDTATAGKIYIAGMVDDPTTSSSGTGTLATIIFQGKADGQVTLTIDCNTSKIVKNDINATNVLQCSQNGQATITVGTGSSGSSSDSSSGSSSQSSSGDSSTNSSGDNSASTPSTLPKSGIFDNVVKLAVPGIILLFLGSAVRLLL